MADGNFYENYMHMDSAAAMVHQIGNYRAHSDPSTSYADGGSEKTSSSSMGYYQSAAHYPTVMPDDATSSTHGLTVSVPGMESALMAGSMPAMALPSMSQEAGLLTTAPVATTHLPGMYDSASSYVKTERHSQMPPTPPGSPEEPKDMAMQAAVPGYVSPDLVAQGQLAKPVPMRRLSEKRIAQARAHLTTGYSMGGDQLMGHTPYGSSSAIAHALSLSSQTPRRPRSEKKPIPEDAKDGKYFERRKRNNHAAKKSRDARKAREDEIAIRASFLEKENAILRAQVATLREEANSLRQLLLQKRSRP